jgi:hypothetical protein
MVVRPAAQDLKGFDLIFVKIIPRAHHSRVQVHRVTHQSVFAPSRPTYSNRAKV